MNKEQLTRAFKMLAQGRVAYAEVIADMLCPEPKTFVVEVPHAPKKTFKESQ